MDILANLANLLLPQGPHLGPPLPQLLGIFWPGAKAAVGIEVLEHESPLTVEEGKSYTVKVTVTNASTKGGVPCAAVLRLRTRASGNGITFIPTTDESAEFPAGGSLSWTYTMTIPMMGEGSGVIDAVITSPIGGILTSATEYLTIKSIAIVYGAAVTIG